MNSRLSSHFFFGLLLAVSVLAFCMFLPFLTPIVLAGALSVVFKPLHRFIRRKVFLDREDSSAAALITLIIVTIVVLVPLLLIAGKVYSEVQNTYVYLTDESGRSQVITALNNLTSKLSHMFFDLYPAYTFDSFNVTSLLTKGLEWIFANLDTVFGGASKFGIGVFILFLSLFYLLRDGQKLKRNIIALSPLIDGDDEHILRKMQQAIYSIFAGSIAVGIIQGILTGIGFALFHVPSPALWGAIAAIAALIPGIGTALILVPGILYLFFTGDTSNAIGLLIWGLVAVGLIDNFLGPILVNRGVKIHPFLILISVLGGLIFFGAVGFLLGPMVLAFLFALLEIYRTSFKDKIN